MKLNWKNAGSHNIVSLVREGRPCDHRVIAQQIGRINILGVSGGRVGKFTTTDGDEVGLFLPIDTARRVEVVLDWMDTYIVSRVRYIVRGANAGQEIVEDTQSDIYCDGVGEAVYQASCWK